MRAAIYARFSSDLQKDRSIEDQIALCETFAARNDLDVTHRFHDRARSGASIFGRDGLLAMMDAARDRSFDVLVVEALDRVSRDQEDLAGIYKRLSFAGIRILAVHDGVADQVQIGIRGLVGALYLQDLAHKVRRGMSGALRDGRHPGGRAYGYRPRPGQPGEQEIYEPEASIVRRIFAEYAAGSTPREIAFRLNREGVPSPRGGRWNASTINGNKTRGHGILLNHIYRGEIVWNRVRMVKDPDSGKRISRVNPESEWERQSVPHLSIVPDELAAVVLDEKERRAVRGASHTRRPKRILSGLLKCGCCGAGMTAKDSAAGRVRVVCSRVQEAGDCASRKSYYLDTIEPVVLCGLRERLADREAIALYVSTYNEERRRLAGDRIHHRTKMEARLGRVEIELKRIVRLMIEERISDDLGAAQLRELEIEKKTLGADLALIPADDTIISIHPGLVADYLATIDRIGDALNGHDGPAFEEAKLALRDLIDSVVIHPKEGRDFEIEVNGQLSKLLGGNHFPQMRTLGGKVVAAVRYRRSPQEVRLPFSFIARSA